MRDPDRHIERENVGTPTRAGRAPRPTPRKGVDTGPYCEPEICVYTVEGPFAFAFTVPFAPSRVSEPRQTSDVSGESIILDRVSATPTGTVVTLPGAGPDATVTLTGGGETHSLHQSGPIPAQRTADQPFDYVTTEVLDDGQGSGHSRS